MAADPPDPAPPGATGTSGAPGATGASGTSGRPGSADGRALAVALALAETRPLWQRVLWVAAGVLALALGLVYFGRDGKMATYGLLVLVTGTLAFWRHRA